MNICGLWWELFTSKHMYIVCGVAIFILIFYLLFLDIVVNLLVCIVMYMLLHIMTVLSARIAICLFLL